MQLGPETPPPSYYDPPEPEIPEDEEGCNNCGQLLDNCNCYEDGSEEDD